ncbi:polysaccharide biosynthesis/export family protein [Roseomonas sp. HJA6]|uniref:Polysaccharide biosynthesis/export family protein n=1 Tax=Roseomonas alba TaxID=2846776 RepID=A0ABS7A2E7_9PROT|nr:polysaccharide biosynthesis/export family protein [Neoroseomonas alba]MBW6396481.1 polysaccharide biosynthesis/export family protein [Neoroseomonas alba]
MIRLARLCLTTLLLALGSSYEIAAAEPFILGPGDRVSVIVHRRADLSGEFRVLPGGALSLPFIGTVPAAGQSIEEVRETLMRRMRDDASLLDPRVSVEVVELQPVLVAGNVRRPGQVPFQYGMTVAHALAAAGGPRRIELEEVGARVEVFRLRERFRQSQDAMGLMLIRQARLAAEASGAEEFAPPVAAARFLPGERLEQTVAAERDIMRRRNAGFTSLISMLDAQAAAFNDEIRALREQNESKDREAALLEQERAYVADLMRQGLTARDSRVVQLARAAVQVEGERRQILAFIARARQELARVEQTRSHTEVQRQLEITTGLKEAEDSLTGLRVALEEVRASLAQLHETLPPDDVPLGSRAAPMITIMRVRSSPPQRIMAHSDTPLMPGDLVEVPLDGSEPGRRLASGAQPAAPAQ